MSELAAYRNLDINANSSGSGLITTTASATLQAAGAANDLFKFEQLNIELIGKTGVTVCFVQFGSTAARFAYLRVLAGVSNYHIEVPIVVNASNNIILSCVTTGTFDCQYSFNGKIYTP